MDGVRSELPAMDLKKIKKTMKRCRKKSHSKNMKGKLYEDEYEYEDEACSDDHHCPGIYIYVCVIVYRFTHETLIWTGVLVCDETFFPSLQRETTIVVRCFNEKAKKLLELHLPTGFQRFTLWLKGSRNKQQYHDSLIQQGKDLVNYAIINSMALRKMLKKYDKIHRSKQGQAFKMQIQIMHIEILRSPWLCELLAFYLNNSNNNNNNNSPIGNDIHGLLKDMSLTFDEGSNKPSLTCGFFDSFSINVDLTCSICLVIKFHGYIIGLGLKLELWSYIIHSFNQSFLLLSINQSGYCFRSDFACMWSYILLHLCLWCGFWDDYWRTKRS